MMLSTGRNEARRSSLSYDAAVTLDQSGRRTGRQAGRLAGRQAAAHSRGNDTALLLWERLTESEQGEMRYRGVRALLASAVL